MIWIIFVSLLLIIIRELEKIWNKQDSKKIEITCDKILKIKMHFNEKIFSEYHDLLIFSHRIVKSRYNSLI